MVGHFLAGIVLPKDTFRGTSLIDGPPIVLVHGTPSWSYIWRNVAPRLAKSFQVFVYDLAGYGTSEQREDQDIRIRTHATTLAELLRHWGLQNPHLVGHDFGGTTVMGAHLVVRCSGVHYCRRRRGSQSVGNALCSAG